MSTNGENTVGDTERSVTLTEKGMELYTSNRDKILKKLDSLWSNVQILLDKMGGELTDYESLRTELDNNYGIFCEEMERYMDFLSRARHELAALDMVSAKQRSSACSSIIQAAMGQLKFLQKFDTRSQASIKHKSQEKINEQLQISEREFELERRRLKLEHDRKDAEINMELKLLRMKKEAVAMADDFKPGQGELGKEPEHVKLPPQVEDDKLRTEQYVHDHVHYFGSPTHAFTGSVPTYDHGGLPQPSDDSMALGLTRFLLKKDLLMQRLTVFDEKPEMFCAWKASFKCVTRELSVTASEELDLLVRWLGPESSKHAKTVRVSNATDPTWGLAKVWERLEERYGAPEIVEASITQKLTNFPKLGNRDNKKLYDLVDIMLEIQSLMNNPRYALLFSYFNTSSGILPIISRLPYNIQEKWALRASNYKRQHSVLFPPFSYLLDFVKEFAKMRNDPGFSFLYDQSSTKGSTRQAPNQRILARKTELKPDNKAGTQQKPHEISDKCPVHGTSHSLNKCREFRTWDFNKRKDLLRSKGICFKCCRTNQHLSKDCTPSEPCSVCNSNKHATAMHIDRMNSSKQEDKQQIFVKLENKEPIQSVPQGHSNHGGELSNDSSGIVSKCTHLCGSKYGNRSCSKTVLVQVYQGSKPEKAVTVYAILDEQSNKTLAHSALLDELEINGPSVSYKMLSCSGSSEVTGRRASNLFVRSSDGSVEYQLPTVLECSEIPSESCEIPTPEVARAHAHLRDIADYIPPLKADKSIQLLIGRDLVEAHHVQQQITGPKGSPFAQQMSLGWVIIGDVCIGKWHKEQTVNVLKTTLVSNGRASLFKPCDAKISVREVMPDSDIGNSIFVSTPDDERIGTSYEDRQFLKIMDSQVTLDPSGVWTAPLPFKSPRLRLPDNRPQAVHRAQLLESSLRKNPTKLEHFVTFMDKIISSGAAEEAPEITDTDQERWYLPIFGVYHPKKPTQLRGVFDSSVMYKGLSLNNIMLTGPNLTNSLLGVLLRFRKDECAVTADIEQMFYRFYVNPEHRNYLRFFWFKDNNPTLPLTEYRMRVHVFGNRPSPAVATYGLRKAVENAERDVRDFVNRDFYVDDALTSLPTREQAVSLLKRTQKTLQDVGKIRLHKIASNDVGLMDQFPKEDLGKDLKDLDISSDSLPIQHSLGLAWNINSDKFVFDAPSVERPFTRRGLLSAISSIFDPVGFVSPLTVSGKILMRLACPEGVAWDETLPSVYKDLWTAWCDNLHKLNGFEIPRMYVPSSLSLAKRYSLLIYSDASESAVAAAAYILVTDSSGQDQIGFVLGKAKLAPPGGTSIPRLELCAALLATELGQIITEHLEIAPTSIKYFTDSKVVLGYIRNKKRRFYTYVSNRVAKIHHISLSEQWNYVPSHKNPADAATRDSSSEILLALRNWIEGPIYLLNEKDHGCETEDFPLLNPEEDREIRPVHNLKTALSMTDVSVAQYFNRATTWEGLIRAIAILQHIAHTFHEKNAVHQCKGWHICKEAKTLDARRDAENFILRVTQEQDFDREIDCLKQKTNLPRNSRIISLSPYIDDKGILRVGGRLNNMADTLGLSSLNPVIVPKGHISTLLARHHHERCYHQGRKFTEGQLRSNGYWILGAKRLVSSLIFNCVPCRKLRGKVQEQKMANLPKDRLTPGPPFSAVGVDMFGPWQVTTRKTRGVWERMIGVIRNILNGMLLKVKGKELTHEVLCTLMAEVSAIVNSRPITSISMDPDSPIILSPNILLTQKQGEVPSIAGNLSLKDIYTASWKHVQYLADLFWKKWHETYLCELQARRKWCQERPNIKDGDIVLVRDKNIPRNDRPIGIVEQAIKSDDDLVRKAVIRLHREDKRVTYTRPISDLILLVDE